MKFEEKIAAMLVPISGLGQEEILSLLEQPKDRALGDYAFPCFTLSKSLKKAPNQIATELSKSLMAKKPEDMRFFEKIESNGPYLNFFVSRNAIAGDVITTVLSKGDSYGIAAQASGHTVLVESPGPNTNKPLHLGHVRNMCLGQSVLRLQKAVGHKTFMVNIINDRGIHICKSMLAYQKWGGGKTPESEGIKPDHFVGDYYVLYSKNETPETNKELYEMLRKWEQGDKETVELWKKMNDWAYEGYAKTYNLFNFSTDKDYYESAIYSKGKEIVQHGIKMGVFKKDHDGSIFIQFDDAQLGKKVVQRADGTSVYITQDLATAEERYTDYHMDKMIYVVATEQIYHFRVLFRLLELLKKPFAKACYHLAYGMVNLPEGKMKSREGTVVDADDIVAEMEKLAEEEVRKRYPEFEDDEIEIRARVIAMAALRFFILKFDVVKDMVYNPKESISFEGDTGPYVQYTYARISSILRKFNTDFAEKIEEMKPDYSLLKDETEKKLLQSLMEFPAVVKEAAHSYKPNLIARYLLDLSQVFNEFYHKCPILISEKKLMDARLHLIAGVRHVLKNGLALLEIDVLEEM